MGMAGGFPVVKERVFSVALLPLLFLLLEPLALLLLPLLKLHGELAQPVRQVHPPQLGVVLDGQLQEDRDTVKRSIIIMIKPTTGEQMYLHGFHIREKPGHLHHPGLVVQPEEGVGEFSH